jgi:hypothetical protein
MKQVDEKGSRIAIWIITILIGILLIASAFLGTEHQVKSPDEQLSPSADFSQPLVVVLIIIFFGAFAYSMFSGESGNNIDRMSHGSPGSSGLRLFLTLASWLYPIALIASFYATWAIAWAMLGHMPRPSMDDPKYISGWVDVPYTTTLLLMIGFPAALVGAVSWTAWTGVQQKLSRLTKASVLILLITLWIGTISFLRADPWQVVYWFGD